MPAPMPALEATQDVKAIAGPGLMLVLAVSVVLAPFPNPYEFDVVLERVCDDDGR